MSPFYRKEVIIIKDKKLLLSLSVFFIAFLLTGCFPFGSTLIIEEVLLASIEVDPASMEIATGTSKTITSVTAYYDNGTSADIDLSDCTYESNKSNATVSSSGVVTGIYSCSATTPVTITVSYTEDNITKTDTVSVVVTNPSPGWG